MTRRRELTIRTPDDLLACVPVLLGFVPERSVVMLSLSTAHGPHARVDLVPPEQAPQLAASLTAAARSNGVERVALVVLDDDLDAARVLARVLVDAFVDPALDPALDVVAVLAADGECWSSVHPGPGTTMPRPYDPLHHPFVVGEVVEGRVVRRSRDDVRAQLAPDEREVERLRAIRRDQPGVWSIAPAWVEDLLAEAVAEGRALSVEEKARLLDAVEDPDNRDAAWSWVSRADARAHVELWLAVVRSCPPGEGAAAASLVAFHAWLVGDGALAWCAIERAEEAGGTTLASLVTDLLERAATPMLWRPLRRRSDDGTEGAA